MSEEKALTMGDNIAGRVRNYVIFYTILGIVLIWRSDIQKIVTDVFTADASTVDWVQNVAASVVMAIVGAALFLLNFGRDIDLHNTLDKWFFRVRAKTSLIIQDEMIETAQRLGANGWENMKGKEEEVRDLFYHFINQQEVLRALAFTRWEQYFVNIYVIFFGVIGLVIATVVIIVRGSFDLASIIPAAVFLLMIVLFGLTTMRSLVPKIYRLPRQQISEIYSSKSQELVAEVESRFGNLIS